MKKLLALLVVVTAAVGGGYYYWLHFGQRLQSSEARLETRLTPLSPPFAALVAEVLVKEGDVVEEGQVLYRLDSSALQEKLAREEDLLARTGETLPPEHTDPARAKQGAEDLKALLPLARRQEADAKVEMEALSDARAQAAFTLATLRARGESTPEILRAAVLANDVAAANFITAKERFEQASLARATLENVAAKSPTRQDTMLQSQILLYEAQKERTRSMREAIAAALVRAPGPGLVTRMNVEAGLPAQPGGTLIVFMPFTSEDMWVTAFFTPEQEKSLHTGQVCRIRFEGLSTTMEGTVEAVFPKRIPAHIGRDRIPVRIALPQITREDMSAFRPGLAATVTLESVPAGTPPPAKAQSGSAPPAAPGVTDQTVASRPTTVYSNSIQPPQPEHAAWPALLPAAAAG